MKQTRDQTEVHVSRQTKKVLSTLARHILEEPDEAIGGPTSFMNRSVPDHLQTDEFEYFHLRGRKYWLYRGALWRLSQENTLEHLTEREVDGRLWAFVCQLVVKRDGYRDQRRRANAIEDFLRSTERPWLDFEAIIGLSHLRTSEPFTVADVTFKRLTPTAARKWGLHEREYFASAVRRLSGSVAVVTVRAGTYTKALERAQQRVDDALSVLRLGIVGSIYANVWDEQMLFQRNGVWAVKALGDDSSIHTNFERGFRPMGFDIPDSLANTLTEYLRPIEGVIAICTRDLEERVLTAVHWISRSVTRESFDDKITDLCTALETLLTTRNEQRKADAIAVRSMLLPAALGQGFPDPGIVFFLYDQKRSQLVHGSDRRISNEEDYVRLRHLAVYMVKLYVQMVETLSGNAKHSRILEAIDSPHLLIQALSFLEACSGPVADDLHAFVERRFAIVATTDALAVLASGLLQPPVSSAAAPAV
jgi:hypothetical protein